MGIFDWKHWIVILAVAMLIFGTKKLKTLGSDVGEGIKGFRKAMADEQVQGAQHSLEPCPNALELPATERHARPVSSCTDKV